MAKDDQISIRLTAEEKKLLEQDAEKEQRSISNLLLWCWKHWRVSKKDK
jgi:uncharacterized protein (DUF1778 family)